ncbi:MAG TPA: exopolyphosphatase [Chloroflexota bacterium]|nr:exopolyphosphatase [Chloroflexota bacterium]
MQLVTRSDFDGLICATLLKHIGVVDSYRFVHPKDMQDGKYQASEDDVLANVPYVPGCGLWFDHHSSEQERLGPAVEYPGRYISAPSCARVIWDYYGGHTAFPERFDEMMTAVDNCDSAHLTREDIARPTGWVLLNFLVDPRTGLGRYRDYRISNYQLAEALVDYCRTLSIDEILALPDVQERITRYWEQEGLFRGMIEENAMMRGSVVVLDLRKVEEIYTGNRFTLYMLYPDAAVSILTTRGVRNQNTVITCGYSIINRSATADIGSLMLHYGGGGHRTVGTCQVAHEDADRVIGELVATLGGPPS